MFRGSRTDVADDFVREKLSACRYVVEVVLRDIPAVVVFLISDIGKTYLFEIVGAGRSSAAFTGGTQRWHEDSRKYRDDGDNDQKFDKGKPVLVSLLPKQRSNKSSFLADRFAHFFCSFAF